MGAGRKSLSWINKEDLRQEEEFESDFEGCGKGQITLMLGMAAPSTETRRAPTALSRIGSH